jgi:hypothetical protein
VKVSQHKNAVQPSNTEGSSTYDRKNTIVCSFDPASPRLNAFEFNEWIYGQLQIPGHLVLMIQIDGTRRQVFITCMFSSGYFPGVRLSFADVSEPSARSIFKGWMKNND